MSVTQQIKDRIDIVQYIQEYVPGLKKAGRYYKACCPFHNENTPSFVVNQDTQSWRCFGACAEGGDIFTFVQKMNGWAFPEALRELGQRAGVEIQEKSPQQQKQDEHYERLRGLLQTAADFYHRHLLSDDPRAQRTLFYTRSERGFTMETIREFEIGYAPDEWHHMLDALKQIGYSEDEIVEAGIASRNEKGNIYDRFRNRLVIPIHDERGRVVGFGARALAPDDTPKYLNSPQTPIFDKSSLLFGLHKAKRSIRDTSTAVIVEGYMDVVQAHQAGYYNVVAQMGTAMTEAQLNLIAPRYATRIIMALDADEAGQNATRRSLEVARQALEADYMGKMSVDIRVLHIDDAKDPDDVLRTTPEKWPHYVEQAKPVADFVIEMETVNLSRSASVQERQEIARSVLPILAASENKFYKQENLQKLALKLRISEQDLLGWAQEIKQLEDERKARQRSAPSKLQPPPTLNDDFFPGSYEPPPGFNYGDTDYLPEYDEDWDIDADGYVNNLPPSPAAPPMAEAIKGLRFSGQYSSREIERVCLWFILHNPDWLAKTNRMIRETIGINPEALIEDLEELKTEDFSQADYKVILETLILALNQDELRIVEFIQEQIDPALSDVLDDLNTSPHEFISRKLQNRFPSEVKSILDLFFRRVRAGGVDLSDLIAITLIVKKYRIIREQQEIRFLILDNNQDGSVSERGLYAYNVTLAELSRALASVDLQLEKYRRDTFPNPG